MYNMILLRLRNSYSSASEHGSSRELYVRELQRYIDVDVFGKCGMWFDDEDDPRFNDKYFFYLALENSLCEDYITEKLYTILRKACARVYFFFIY